MQNKTNNMLTDKEMFDFFESAREQYEEYLKVNLFNKLTVLDVQDERVPQLYDSWDKPLDLCLFKDEKNAFVE